MTKTKKPEFDVTELLHFTRNCLIELLCSTQSAKLYCLIYMMQLYCLVYMMQLYCLIYMMQLYCLVYMMQLYCLIYMMQLNERLWFDTSYAISVQLSGEIESYHETYEATFYIF